MRGYLIILSMPQIFLNLPDAEATRKLGKSLGYILPVGMVLLLEGDLGAGKTTLVQGIGEALGIEDHIVSPTFTLICEYLEGEKPLYHLDLYRLEQNEVRSLHLETYWEGIEVSPGLMVIEWSDRLSYLPPSYLHIGLQYQADFSRRAILSYPDHLNLDLQPLQGDCRNW